jgi:hypothetical protein
MPATAEQSSDITLKPCPFCGETGADYESVGMGGQTVWYKVKCALGCCASTAPFETCEEAAEVWNTRPQDRRVEALLEELDAARHENTALSVLLEKAEQKATEAQTVRHNTVLEALTHKWTAKLEDGEPVEVVDVDDLKTLLKEIPSNATG